MTTSPQNFFGPDLLLTSSGQQHRNPKRVKNRCYRRLATLAALLVVLSLPSLADDSTAATNTAPFDPVDSSKLGATYDSGIGSDGTVKDQSSYQVRVGELFAPGGEAYIIPILLPTLPEGKQIATVHLRFQLIGLNNQASSLANADLYGLGVRDTAKVLPTDYYQGAKSDPKATLLQANFLTPASKVRVDQSTGPFVETTKEGDAALMKYLNDACSKPENAAKFVILRISYDADTIPTGDNAYMLLSSGASGDNETPLITYTLSKK